MSGAKTPRGLTGWLALFALALQLAVSFAHVHAEDFAGLGHGHIARVSSSDPAPAGPADPDHFTCDICATVHLAGTMLSPVPSALAVPVFAPASRTIAPPSACAAALVSACFPRGPPQA